MTPRGDYLSREAIDAWQPEGTEVDDPRAPLAAAMRELDLDTAYQAAGRHLSIGCVALEITQRCNLDCRLCYLSEHAELVHDLPLPEVFRRIDLIKARYGPGTNVQITGGDTTLRDRDELIAIVRYASERGLIPALFTNGVRADRPLLQDLSAAGLREVAFHVDTTQDRPGIAARSESDLNDIRRRYIARTRGLPLRVLFNTTITDATLDDVPALVHFFLANADVIGLVSFQLQADTGRGTAGRADPGLTIERLTAHVERAAGTPLGFEAPQIGHPRCNRYTSLLVGGDRVVPLCDDPALVARVMQRAAGRAFARHDRSRKLRAIAGLLVRHPRLAADLAWNGRGKIVPLGRALVSGRGRLHRLSIHVHAFMDADRLERDRCRACVFTTMTRDGPLSMCVHNAKRDRHVLAPVRLQDGGFWSPLTGKTSSHGGLQMPGNEQLDRKRAKGRARARLEAMRNAQPAAAASFSDQS